MTNTELSRRAFLRSASLAGAAALASACAPAATAPSPTAKAPATAASAPATTAAAPAAPTVVSSQPPAWQKEWDDLVTAARKEGQVVYDITRSNQGAKEAIADFKKSFPGIEVEQTTSASASPFAEQVRREQQAGIYNWDAYIGGSLTTVYADGSVAPIKPVFTRPDVLDNSLWRDGFDAGWVDPEKQWGYLFQLHIEPGFWIDKNQVNPDEIKSPTDLLSPKWKGKILMADPRINGYGSVPTTAFRLKYGEDAFVKLLKEQDVALNRDTRQITEWMIRGQYAIGFGVVQTILDEFKLENLGNNLQPMPMLGIDLAKPIWLPKQVPHPNAAKVFINWLMTKDGQEAWCKAVGTNSRRTDVPVIAPAFYPKDGMEFHSSNDEKGAAETQKTQDIAKEIIV